MKRKVALAFICLFTLNANASDQKSDTTVVETRSLNGVTITEKASKRQVSSTSPLHSINKDKMASDCQSGQRDVARYSLDNVENITLII